MSATLEEHPIFSAFADGTFRPIRMPGVKAPPALDDLGSGIVSSAINVGISHLEDDTRGQCNLPCRFAREVERTGDERAFCSNTREDAEEPEWSISIES
jgi:hypothetical protein